MTTADYAVLVPALAAVLMAVAAYIRAALAHSAVRDHLAYHPSKTVSTVRQPNGRANGRKV